MKYFCTKIAPHAGLSFTSQLHKEAPICSPVCRRKHVPSFSSPAVNGGEKQVRGKGDNEENKISKHFTRCLAF